MYDFHLSIRRKFSFYLSVNREIQLVDNTDNEYRCSLGNGDTDPHLNVYVRARACAKTRDPLVEIYDR